MVAPYELFWAASRSAGSAVSLLDEPAG